MEIAAKAKKKKKNGTREGQFRYDLDTCSKTGDLAGALALYESASAENLRLSSYHFNSLLHIISTSVETLDEPTKKSAIDTGFAIFDQMAAAGASPTEATITSMARIAAQRPDGGADFAFELVKTMGQQYGATPRLRTYGPALFTFCGLLEADKAYAVERHMESMGVAPEELEIAALLQVSTKVGSEEKIYEYLHKLRGSVGCVAGSTADILEEWFRSERAMEIGRTNWDAGRVKDAILMNGGGWHGLGWLGEGGWDIRRANISSGGHCNGCGLTLACVDIDRMETEKFAESVASLALSRETKSNFRIFLVKGNSLQSEMLVMIHFIYLFILFQFCSPNPYFHNHLIGRLVGFNILKIGSLLTTELRNIISIRRKLMKAMNPAMAKHYTL